MITLNKCKVWMPDELPQGSEQWLRQRELRLTASRAGEILTPAKMEPSKSLSLYAQEVALLHVPAMAALHRSMQWAGNKHTDYGNENESKARDMVRATLPDHDVIEVGFVSRAEAYEPFGCSPDGIICGPDGPVGGLEIKCPSDVKQIGRCVLGTQPGLNDYKLQCLFSMWVTGLPEWTLAVLTPIGLSKLVFRCAEYESEIMKIEAAAKQWQKEMVGYYEQIAKRMNEATIRHYSVIRIR